MRAIACEYAAIRAFEGGSVGPTPGWLLQADR